MNVGGGGGTEAAADAPGAGAAELRLLPSGACERVAAQPRRSADGGAFRGRFAVTGEAVFVAARRDGLEVVHGAGAGAVRERAAWASVASVRILPLTPAGDRRGDAIDAVRVTFPSGETLDLADAAAPDGAVPARLDEGGPPAIRIERVRMLAAAVIASAGLAPRTRTEFHRGGRALAVPDLAPSRTGVPLWLHGLLVAASVGVFALFPGVTWRDSAAMVAALLVHEAGHASAMRLVGMRIRTMLVLPGLGAATVPDGGFTSDWKDALVSLAGPFTGVPVALVVLAACDAPPAPWLRWGIFVAVALGLLNLIPIAPLDGGRVLLAVAGGAARRARLVIAGAPFVLAVAALAVTGSGDGTVPVGLLVGASVAVFVTDAHLRRRASRDWARELPCGVGAVRTALRDVTFALRGEAREDADGGLPAEPMTRFQAALAIALLAALVLALAALTRALAPVLPEVRLLPGFGDG